MAVLIFGHKLHSWDVVSTYSLEPQDALRTIWSAETSTLAISNSQSSMKLTSCLILASKKTLSISWELSKHRALAKCKPSCSVLQSHVGFNKSAQCSWNPLTICLIWSRILRTRLVAQYLIWLSMCLTIIECQPSLTFWFAMQVRVRALSLPQLNLKRTLWLCLTRSRRVSRSCTEISLRISVRWPSLASKRRSSKFSLPLTLLPADSISHQSTWLFRSNHQRMLKLTFIGPAEQLELVGQALASPFTPLNKRCSSSRLRTRLVSRWRKLVFPNPSKSSGRRAVTLSLSWPKSTRRSCHFSLKLQKCSLLRIMVTQRCLCARLLRSSQATTRKRCNTVHCWMDKKNVLLSKLRWLRLSTLSRSFGISLDATFLRRSVEISEVCASLPTTPVPVSMFLSLIWNDLKIFSNTKLMPSKPTSR